MVKHPTYIRQSLQIRERCGFESRQVYQFAIVLITCLLISTVADARNFIAKKCMAEHDNYSDIAFCIDSTRNENIRKANAKQWEFLKKNPRYRFPGQSLNKCFGMPKESVIHRVETTNDKTVLYYKNSIRPCVSN